MSLWQFHPFFGWVYFFRAIDLIVLHRSHQAWNIFVKFERKSLSGEAFWRDINGQSCQKCKWYFGFVFHQIEFHDGGILSPVEGCFWLLLFSANTYWSNLTLDKLFFKLENFLRSAFRKVVYTRVKDFYALQCITSQDLSWLKVSALYIDKKYD